MMSLDPDYSPPDPSLFGGDFDPMRGAPYFNEMWEEIPPPSATPSVAAVLKPWQH